MTVDVLPHVIQVLDEVLALGGRGLAFTRHTPLLGAVPELDSMAVVALITMLEERLGIELPDDEIDAQAFATVGALADFVSAHSAP
jgi:acyl carrier protein